MAQPPRLNTLSGMPQMGAAFAGWANDITIYKRHQSVLDGLVSYKGPATSWDATDDYDNPVLFDEDGEKYNEQPRPITAITFRGVIQPLQPKTIALKPEGQRAWEWLQIHCFSGPLNLDDDDQIIWQGRNYKVMGVYNYELNGYIEYHLVRDYQNKPNPTPVGG